MKTEDKPPEESSGAQHPPPWENLTSLASASQENDLTAALQTALDGGSSLTGASLLAVYQAQDRLPTLQLLGGCGQYHLLPEQLSAHELAGLTKPKLWITWNRVDSTLRRAARKADLTYVAMAPLGQPNACIGLVVAADQSQPPGEEILPRLSLLAATLTSLIQQHARYKELQKTVESQRLLDTLLNTLNENLTEGVLLLSPDLRIKWLNHAAEMLLGFNNREAIDQPAEQILIGSEALPMALTDAQKGFATYNLGATHLYRRNGEDFLALLKIFPLSNQEQVENILIMLQDLSEKELMRMQTQQLEQRASLGEVTAAFAHEVRNPVNNISLGLQNMALSLPDGDPLQGKLAKMLQDCDRIEGLVKAVLAYSRPTEYEMELVDLAVILERLLDRLQPRITRLNVRLNLQFEADCPPVAGNLRALEQVFTNLITNSLEAMNDGGELIIKLKTILSPEGRPYLEVGVADTGPGIPKEEQERIFQPFYTTKRTGTGLGLPIVKQIISAHKGSIHLTSFPGATVFYIHLPVSEPED
ncbi:MAG: PAS domain-containing protein [Anaerolineales bacterium]|nr:PAS domain-containing protein [Anaerolineales bacterium]